MSVYLFALHQNTYPHKTVENAFKDLICHSLYFQNLPGHTGWEAVIIFANYSTSVQKQPNT